MLTGKRKLPNAFAPLLPKCQCMRLFKSVADPMKRLAVVCTSLFIICMTVLQSGLARRT